MRIGEEVWPVDPGVVGRCAWEVDETRRDIEVLAWVGRFRFVTAPAVGQRFGVSVQRANARVRRLEAVGLLGCERQFVSQARAVYVTGKGFELLGQPRRRAPRPDVQREHEAAIVDLVRRLEVAPRGATVLTERECRQLEHAGADKFSVEISAIHSDIARRDRTRWPDVVVEVAGGRRAIELEFAPKGGKRLKAIVNAYAFSPRYGETLFMVRNAALGRRILEYARSAHTIGGGPAKVRVVAWPGLPLASARRSRRRSNAELPLRVRRARARPRRRFEGRAPTDSRPSSCRMQAQMRRAECVRRQPFHLHPRRADRRRSGEPRAAARAAADRRRHRGVARGSTVERVRVRAPPARAAPRRPDWATPSLPAPRRRGLARCAARGPRCRDGAAEPAGAACATDHPALVARSAADIEVEDRSRCGPHA